MAVTHADLAPGPRSTEVGSKTGAFIIVLSILFGLLSFVLSLIAEATRSEATWLNASECTYSGSGKTPLLCATGAFLGLAMGMVVAHVYLMVAVSKSPAPAIVTLDPDSPLAQTLTFQAGFFFITTWIAFSVGEVLLLIGLSIESGHLKDYSTPRLSCLIIKQGIFSAAGVFGLLTVFLAAGLYITVLRAQTLMQDQDNVRREVMEAAVLHSSPPRSPPLRQITAVSNENPVVGGTRNERTLADYLSVFSKQSSLV